MKKRVITFGEVMMRLSTKGFKKFSQATEFSAFFGGSEANVSVSLSHFGFSAAHVTRFPDNDLGRAAASALAKHGVDTNYIHFGGERLGLYFFENGAMLRSPKITYDRFHSSFSEIQPNSIDWDEIFKDADWFHWTGITPAISSNAAQACLDALKSARRKNVQISGDINYRRNLWQYGKTAKDVMPELIGYCDKLVGAPEDFKNCLGIESLSFGDACAAVFKEVPSVKQIAVTQRETISASHNQLHGILWNGHDRSQSKIHDLTHMVDRIGGGDAFMAGLIYSWLCNKDDQYTIEFATAASALKHTIEGDVNIVSVDEVEQIMGGDTSGKLLR